MIKQSVSQTCHRKLHRARRGHDRSWSVPGTGVYHYATSAHALDAARALPGGNGRAAA